MRSIMCSVQDGTTIKEYEMTCEDEKINQFFERLDSTVIQPISINEADNSIRMYKVIMNAMGGVLFVDEAYSLAISCGQAGAEAIANLIKAMEDYKAGKLKL